MQESYSGTLSTLRGLLEDHFNLDEFRTLCFELSVNYDNLPGEGLAAKSRELVTFMERAGQIPELLAALLEKRPNVPWPAIQPDVSDRNSTTHYLPEGSPDMRSTSKDSGQGDNYHIGSVTGKATIVQGPYAQVTVLDSSVSGTFSDTSIEVQTILTRARQLIDMAPWNENGVRIQLLEHVDELQHVLTNSSTAPSEAEEIADSVTALIGAAARSDTDRPTFERLAGETRRITSKLGSKLPQLLGVTEQIISIIANAVALTGS